MTDAKPKRAPVDWEAIEREYRAGQLSLREIGRQYDLTEGAIRKRAKVDSWQRPIADKVREAVRERLVRSEGTQNGTQRETIELAAERGVQIVREHRVQISRARGIASTLFGELEAVGSGESAPSLKDRTMAFGNLTTSLKTLVGLERQAFNLSDEPSGDKADVTVELVRFA